MKTSVKNIYNTVQMLNPTVSEISSLGQYVSHSSQMVADQVYKDAISHVSDNSLAYKILFDHDGRKKFSDKQLWVIAFELLKNEEYCTMIAEEDAKIARKQAVKDSASKAKLAANKESSQSVLDFVKSNGKKLGDYYAFVKKSAYKKEFYSKKFSMTSAEAFLSI